MFNVYGRFFSSEISNDKHLYTPILFAIYIHLLFLFIKIPYYMEKGLHIPILSRTEKVSIVCFCILVAVHLDFRNVYIRGSLKIWNNPVKSYLAQFDLHINQLLYCLTTVKFQPFCHFQLSRTITSGRLDNPILIRKQNYLALLMCRSNYAK